MSLKPTLLTLMILLTSASPVLGKDFGKRGHAFEIKEEGFLAMIHRKLQNIDIEAENAKMQERARQKVEEPQAVVGIRRAKENKTFMYDATYTLKEDIKLPDGKLLYAAGTKINPLDNMEFNRKLYFIDAKDEVQVDWLRSQLESKSRKDKGIKDDNILEEKDVIETRIILVSGKPLELGEKLGREVYFDQFGELVGKFGISHVPAIVEQAVLERGEKILEVREVRIDG